MGLYQHRHWPAITYAVQRSVIAALPAAEGEPWGHRHLTRYYMPSSPARATAAPRLETPSLRYIDEACVFTVAGETRSCCAISRRDRWVASNGRRRSSAVVSEEAPPP